MPAADAAPTRIDRILALAAAGGTAALSFGERAALNGHLRTQIKERRVSEQMAAAASRYSDKRDNPHHGFFHSHRPKGRRLAMGGHC